MSAVLAEHDDSIKMLQLEAQHHILIIRLRNKLAGHSALARHEKFIWESAVDLVKRVLQTPGARNVAYDTIIDAVPSCHQSQALNPIPKSQSF